MRVVIDSNVFMSGIFFGGPPGQIVDAWKGGRLGFVLSPSILDEYRRVGEELETKYGEFGLSPILTLVVGHAEIVDAPDLEEGVARDPDDDKFLACAAAAAVGIPRRGGPGGVMGPASFRTVVSLESDLQFLDPDELTEVISAENRGDLFVGGAVNPSEEVLVLYRGSFDRLSVPFAWFDRKSDGEPDFETFAVIDHGQTIRLGAFEVAADAILYDFHSHYRRRAKKRQLKLNDSWGGGTATEVDRGSNRQAPRCFAGGDC